MPNYHELEIAAALDHVEETLRLARERRSLAATTDPTERGRSGMGTRHNAEGAPSEDDAPTD